MEVVLAETVKEALNETCYGCEGCLRHHFVQLLADRLPMIVAPNTFITCALLLIHDLRNGLAASNRHSDAFRDMPPLVFDALIDELPEVASIALPSSMAACAEAHLAWLQRDAGSLLKDRTS
ncbi:MAG: hypothetical protein PHS79_03895 [Patescibacteria group bacterium]|nr:hypothetical protein [Patescibacteria group bacterium]